MTPKFDPNQSFSKVYGSSPASFFQNSHYFSGDGTYVTWAQAAGEEAKIAMDTGREEGALSLDELASGITETGETSKSMAAELNSEGKTDAEIGELMGVARRTVTDWLDRTNGGRVNTIIDRRDKVLKEEHPVIASRLEAGETQAQVAVDYGISQRQVSNIAKRSRANASIDLP